MDLGLKGKKAIITGGSKGIGLATAHALADEGADVAICSRKADDVNAALEALSSKGVNAIGGAADVADGDGVGATRRLYDGAEGAEQAVLDVHPHLGGRVVRPVPQLDVRVERAALGGEDHLHRFDKRVAE